MIDWTALAFMSIGPLGALVAGLLVYAIHMRDERKWAEIKRRQQTPAE
jgi:hypothetical protein